MCVHVLAMDRMMMNRRGVDVSSGNVAMWFGRPLWEVAKGAKVVLVPRVFGLPGEAKHTRLLPLLRNGILTAVEGLATEEDMQWLAPRQNTPPGALLYSDPQSLYQQLLKITKEPAWAEQIRNEALIRAQERYNHSLSILSNLIPPLLHP